MTPRFPDAPSRLAHLPRDRRGFPVPWFVSWGAGEPRFPVVDAAKLSLAWNEERCWVCGDRLGAHRGWVVGPMSVIEGATPEPPSHYECAAFSVSACPHLSTADARFSGRYADDADCVAQPNISKATSAVTAIWITKGRGATPFRAGAGTLFGLAEPTRLEWYAAGRPASDGEVRVAIEQAVPTLRTAAVAQGRAADFEARLRWLERWAPARP
jgi:hypothetical protein